MRTDLFDYELPSELVAQRPLAGRDAARLLVLRADAPEHRMLHELPELIEPGALVVLNETRVIRARLIGKKRPGGGRMEVFLLRRLGPLPNTTAERWQALGRSNRSVRVGTVVDFDGVLEAVIDRNDGGSVEVTLSATQLPSVEQAIAAVGRVPLPPYMKRSDDAQDGERYQTVFARHAGSVAAPTAGLHLTHALLQRMAARGIEIGRLTLHVGLGTFRPVTASDLDDHDMHEEYFEVSRELAEQIAGARERGGKVVAIGTTVVRALESARDAREPSRVVPGAGWTRLLIQPGFRFGPTDALLTNFHMPRSTLLALVAAFAGRERVLAAYQSAILSRYRLLSYGDAMWIPERLSP